MASRPRLSCSRTIPTLRAPPPSNHPARGVRMFDSLRQDVTGAIRGLIKSPGFAAASLITLALGIGATSAVFSVAKAVLITPLPYAQPERIVQLFTRWTAFEKRGGRGVIGHAASDRIPDGHVRGNRPADRRVAVDAPDAVAAVAGTSGRSAHVRRRHGCARRRVIVGECLAGVSRHSRQPAGRVTDGVRPRESTRPSPRRRGSAAGRGSRRRARAKRVIPAVRR